MRQSRLVIRKGEGVGYYHCISRVVDRQFVMGDEEKTYFREWMRKLARFSGLEIVTYCLMSNHVHLLIRVPDRGALRDLSFNEMKLELRVLYGLKKRKGVIETNALMQEIERAEASGSEQWMGEIRQRFEARRGNLSAYMKELKQRFTQWFNRRRGRKGTLWEERFKSVLVEGSESALLTVAAYIDLNPVRAGLAEDPKNYRWSGYGEAMGGGKVAKRGLTWMLREGGIRGVSWKVTMARYRLLLFERGEEIRGGAGEIERKGIAREQVDETNRRGGKLTVSEALRCRVRYFCDGAILGDSAFVERVFEGNRERYGDKRNSGARKMRGAEWGKLRVFRALRLDVIG